MQVYSNNSLADALLDWPVYMRRSLELACRVITATPNPRVGCVITSQGKIVGEGWHSGAGQAHAEVVALQQAGASAESATAFVSLEPCAHTGRTGPCADALITAGIACVVIAVADPNPAVSGKGIARLEAAGIDVIHLVDFEQAAMAINRGYFKRHQRGLPLVRCKLAMSLDGRTALANGDSKWITGAAARGDVQLMRAGSCAIITGSGTTLADDPALTVRLDELPMTDTERSRNAAALSRQPLRVVLDSKQRTPPTAKLCLEAGDVAIFTSSTPAEDPEFPGNVTVKCVSAAPHGVELVSVLESLAAEFACNEVLIEAGATLSTAFIEAGLVDELVIYMAPKIVGMDGRGLLNIAGVKSLSECIEFEITAVSTINTLSAAHNTPGISDIRITLAPLPAHEA